MIIGFILNSPVLSGGTNVIIQYAFRLKRDGHHVLMLTQQEKTPEHYNWHDLASELTWIFIPNCKIIEFDFLISTWWFTIFELHKFKSQYYIHFIQSLEHRFYIENDINRKLAKYSYLLPVHYITEASWIKNYLIEKYNHDVKLVKNGIDKKLYNNIIPLSLRKEGFLRVLVEGSLEPAAYFKNVKRTIELCVQSNADEVWLLTPSEIISYKGVNRVFSNVSIESTPGIYSSCDVLVKLSYIEGMFGPPLEIFHCGGTAIVYDVDGADEYIKHDYNALVVKKDDEQKVIDYINELKSNPAKLFELKKGAKTTADKWYSWDDAYLKFTDILLNLNENKEMQYALKEFTELINDYFCIKSTNTSKLKKIIKNSIIKLPYGNIIINFFKYIRRLIFIKLN